MPHHIMNKTSVSMRFSTQRFHYAAILNLIREGIIFMHEAISTRMSQPVHTHSWGVQFNRHERHNDNSINHVQQNAQMKDLSKDDKPLCVEWSPWDLNYLGKGQIPL